MAKTLKSVQNGAYPYKIKKGEKDSGNPSQEEM